MVMKPQLPCPSTPQRRLTPRRKARNSVENYLKSKYPDSTFDNVKFINSNEGDSVKKQIRCSPPVVSTKINLTSTKVSQLESNIGVKDNCKRLKRGVTTKHHNCCGSIVAFPSISKKVQENVHNTQSEVDLDLRSHVENTKGPSTDPETSSFTQSQIGIIPGRKRGRPKKVNTEPDSVNVSSSNAENILSFENPVELPLTTHLPDSVKSLNLKIPIVRLNRLEASGGEPAKNIISLEQKSLKFPSDEQCVQNTTVAENSLESQVTDIDQSTRNSWYKAGKVVKNGDSSYAIQILESDDDDNSCSMPAVVQPIEVHNRACQQPSRNPNVTPANASSTNAGQVNELDDTISISSSDEYLSSGESVNEVMIQKIMNKEGVCSKFEDVHSNSEKALRHSPINVAVEDNCGVSEVTEHNTCSNGIEGTKQLNSLSEQERHTSTEVLVGSTVVDGGIVLNCNQDLSEQEEKVSNKDNMLSLHHDKEVVPLDDSCNTSRKEGIQHRILNAHLHNSNEACNTLLLDHTDVRKQHQISISDTNQLIQLVESVDHAEAPEKAKNYRHQQCGTRVFSKEQSVDVIDLPLSGSSLIFEDVLVPSTVTSPISSRKSLLTEPNGNPNGFSTTEYVERTELLQKKDKVQTPVSNLSDKEALLVDDSNEFVCKLSTIHGYVLDHDYVSKSTSSGNLKTEQPLVAIGEHDNRRLLSSALDSSLEESLLNVERTEICADGPSGLDDTVTNESIVIEKVNRSISPVKSFSACSTVSSVENVEPLVGEEDDKLFQPGVFRSSLEGVGTESCSELPSISDISNMSNVLVDQSCFTSCEVPNTIPVVVLHKNLKNVHGIEKNQLLPYDSKLTDEAHLQDEQSTKSYGKSQLVHYDDNVNQDNEPTLRLENPHCDLKSQNVHPNSCENQSGMKGLSPLGDIPSVNPLSILSNVEEIIDNTLVVDVGERSDGINKENTFPRIDKPLIGPNVNYEDTYENCSQSNDFYEISVYTKALVDACLRENLPESSEDGLPPMDEVESSDLPSASFSSEFMTDSARNCGRFTESGSMEGLHEEFANECLDIQRLSTITSQNVSDPPNNCSSSELIFDGLFYASDEPIDLPSDGGLDKLCQHGPSTEELQSSPLPTCEKDSVATSDNDQQSSVPAYQETDVDIQLKNKPPLHLVQPEDSNRLLEPSHSSLPCKIADRNVFNVNDLSGKKCELGVPFSLLNHDVSLTVIPHAPRTIYTCDETALEREQSENAEIDENKKINDLLFDEEFEPCINATPFKKYKSRNKQSPCNTVSESSILFDEEFEASNNVTPKKNFEASCIDQVTVSRAYPKPSELLFDEEFEQSNNVTPVKREKSGMNRSETSSPQNVRLTALGPVNELVIDDNDFCPLNEIYESIDNYENQVNRNTAEGCVVISSDEESEDPLIHNYPGLKSARPINRPEIQLSRKTNSVIQNRPISEMYKRNRIVPSSPRKAVSSKNLNRLLKRTAAFTPRLEGVCHVDLSDTESETESTDNPPRKKPIHIPVCIDKPPKELRILPMSNEKPLVLQTQNLIATRVNSLNRSGLECLSSEVTFSSQGTTETQSTLVDKYEENPVNTSSSHTVFKPIVGISKIQKKYGTAQYVSELTKTAHCSTETAPVELSKITRNSEDVIELSDSDTESNAINPNDEVQLFGGGLSTDYLDEFIESDDDNIFGKNERNPLPPKTLAIPNQNFIPNYSQQSSTNLEELSSEFIHKEPLVVPDGVDSDTMSVESFIECEDDVCSVLEKFSCTSPKHSVPIQSLDYAKKSITPVARNFVGLSGSIPSLDIPIHRKCDDIVGGNHHSTTCVGVSVESASGYSSDSSIINNTVNPVDTVPLKVTLREKRGARHLKKSPNESHQFQKETVFISDDECSDISNGDFNESNNISYQSQAFSSSSSSTLSRKTLNGSYKSANSVLQTPIVTKKILKPAGILLRKSSTVFTNRRNFLQTNSISGTEQPKSSFSMCLKEPLTTKLKRRKVANQCKPSTELHELSSAVPRHKNICAESSLKRRRNSRNHLLKVPSSGKKVSSKIENADNKGETMDLDIGEEEEARPYFKCENPELQAKINEKIESILQIKKKPAKKTFLVTSNPVLKTTTKNIHLEGRADLSRSASPDPDKMSSKLVLSKMSLDFIESVTQQNKNIKENNIFSATHTKNTSSSLKSGASRSRAKVISQSPLKRKTSS